jgi:ATP-dependent RNA helicase DHX29
VLQTLCAKWGVGAPRFERRAQGGLRGGRAEAGTRYSVFVEPPARGRATGGGAPPAPTLKFALAEADDGWDTVQDAQNAAAARALFSMTSGPAAVARGDAATALASLGPPWTDLWLAWATSGGGDDGGGDDGDGEAGDRDEFLAALVAEEGGHPADAADAPASRRPAAPPPGAPALQMAGV